MALSVLTGCTLGQPAQFTQRADRLCTSTSRSVERITPASGGVDALRWASLRTADIEHLVAQLTDDPGLPRGSAGAALRQRWLRPARASLVQGLRDLETLRLAVRRHRAAAVGPALTASLRAGTAGVDTALLIRQGMPACAVTFTATTDIR